jgi:hypothetical protein
LLKMCPAEGPKKTRKPPVTRSRASIENYKVMRWLDQERERQGLSLRDVAKALGPGYRNATRVAQYLSQRIVAGPDILQKLAIGVGVSPIDALWNAGHRDAVLGYLQKLYQLGWSWASTDRVSIDETGAQFFGYYEYGQAAFGHDLREPPESLAHRYHLVTIHNREGGIFRIVSLPKPMACAILLAVALFPRRGEQLRPETTPFYERLSLVASNMMPAAEIARVPSHIRTAFKKLFKDAETVLQYRFYGTARLAIVGEYVHSWCDMVCRNYADYARLALYRQGAFVGEPRENEMVSEDIWKWQSTPMPTAEDLQMETE